MKLNRIFFLSLFIIVNFLYCNNSKNTDDGYKLWLKYNKINNNELLKEYQQHIVAFSVKGNSKTCQIIKDELTVGLSGLLGKKISQVDQTIDGCLIVSTPANSVVINKLNYDDILKTLGSEGYFIKIEEIDGRKSTIITANEDIGLLYGTYHLLRLLQTQTKLTNLNIQCKPQIQYRLLNHWDNLNGSVERGYAGKSLWKWDELPEQIDVQYKDYARANASIGINGTVVNNVNADPNILKEEYLKKVAKLAEIFRPYGIKMFLSINFSSPMSPKYTEHTRRKGIGNLATADPLNPEVRSWWKEKVNEIYQYIPDFGGFLIKANSEGMPGPQDYDRSHAEGANMLAEALQPHNGIVMWRAFVYNHEVDKDRAKRAYKEFTPLDGKFLSNVFVQSKNGPIDFQPREPIQPLFGAMPITPLMLELQITQEYLGHATHLVYLAPMWKEYYNFDSYAKGKGSEVYKVVDGSLHNYKMTGVAGVTNIGDDRNWCGHFMAQSNWYAYGRLAWDHSLSSEQIAEEWIHMSISNKNKVLDTVKSMMLGSWEACVNYMTPLGLHHIMQEGFHYGPGPQVNWASREDWNSTYYHKADEKGIGFNRSSSGSNATSQYFPEVRDLFDNIETCPEKYLLWFHHVSWDHKMKSGRTLWEELCYKYFSGTEYVDDMIKQWDSIENDINHEIFTHVKKKLTKHQKDAVEWRDTCLNYFQKFSSRPISTK